MPRVAYPVSWKTAGPGLGTFHGVPAWMSSWPGGAYARHTQAGAECRSGTLVYPPFTV